MGHIAASNALSRSLGNVPMWIVQTVLGLILSGGIAWCTWASVTNWKHEVRIGVVETKVDDIHSDIGEIKGDVKDMNRKLDRLIERSSNGVRSHQ
jgi:hypothetical protein